MMSQEQAVGIPKPGLRGGKKGPHCALVILRARKNLSVGEEYLIAGSLHTNNFNNCNNCKQQLAACASAGKPI